jgi:ribosomal protein S18 acetylase RimI-like enzyme
LAVGGVGSFHEFFHPIKRNARVAIRPRGRRVQPLAVEVYVLCVSREWQRRGLGRALVGEAARFLRDRGRRRLLIGVLAVNVPARRFHEAMGGRVLGRRPFEDEGVILDEAVYEWPDIGRLLADRG